MSRAVSIGLFAVVPASVNALVLFWVLFRFAIRFHLDPSVDAGYYLVVKPLTSGEHRIHFTGSNGGFSSDITYFITVARSDDSDGD
jgi:hypothetical protein